MTQGEPTRRAVGICAALVVTLAIFLRLPASYESFWVDELHTTWAVSGSLPQAVDRAAGGHQTPLYFVAIWFWKQLAGDSEWALRLSSILAVAAACGVLVVAVARTAGTLIAGALSGAVLAIESNSLFFGTELRPYAWVILLASIAVACFVWLWRTDSRHQDSRSWAALVIVCLLAMLAQPTSAGVLAWLPLMLLVRWRWRRSSDALSRWSRTDSVLAAVGIAVAWVIWQTTLRQTWGERQIWAAFASADSFRQVLRVWPWIPLAVVPLMLLAAGRIALISTGRCSPDRRAAGLAVTVLLAAVGITVLYWGVARAEWLPVWHRRYFIAVLPLLAAGAGLSVGSLAGALPGSVAGRSGAWAAAACVVVVLAWLQGTAAGVWRYPRPLVRRGEDWRGAVEWIRSVRQGRAPVFVDAGLIEAALYSTSPARSETEPRLTEAQRQYLSYPLLGPYRLGDRQAVEPIAPSLPWETWALIWETRAGSASPVPPEDLAERDDDGPDRTETAPRSVFIISRRPVAGLKSALRSSWSASPWSSGGPFGAGQADYRGFGGVSVARLRLPSSRDPAGNGPPRHR